MKETPPFDRRHWHDFLQKYGIDSSMVTAQTLSGATTQTYQLQTPSGTFVLRCWRSRDFPPITEQLHLIDHLFKRGFPTSAPIATDSGSLMQIVDDAPAALFRFVEGSHRPTRQDSWRSDDMSIGVLLARLLARMHLLTQDLDLLDLPDARYEDQVDFRIGLIRSDPQWVKGKQITDEAEFLLSEYRATIAVNPSAPVGVIHGDAHLYNVLVDDQSNVVGLIDFDSAHQDILIFDLTAVIGSWARDEGGIVDPERAGELINAYHQVRPLTDTERELLPLATSLRIALGLLIFWDEDKEKDTELSLLGITDRIRGQAY